MGLVCEAPVDQILDQFFLWWIEHISGEKAVLMNALESAKHCVALFRCQTISLTKFRILFGSMNIAGFEERRRVVL